MLPTSKMRLNMEDQKERLQGLIESDFGLLDKLLACGALSYREISEVKSGTILNRKNEFLLNYVFSKNKHQDLMNALLDCNQHHVVNWVRGNGEYKGDFGLDWPLRETEKKILDYNQEALVDLLNLHELLPQLCDKEVINKRQMQNIGSKPTEYERNEALLDAVRRFSRKSYFAFKECLRQSGQSHVAGILEDGRNMKASADDLQFLFPGVDPPELPKPLSSSNAENLQSEFSNIKFGVGSQKFFEKVSQSIEEKSAYKCDSRPLGRAIVINNEYFFKPKLGRREGAAEDRKWLEYLFRSLQFETEIYENLSTTEIVNLLKRESEAKHHKQFDAFALFLLSHGRRNEIYGVDGRTVSVDSINNLFDGKNCPHLINKPKLFFIQACQGANRTVGVIEPDLAADSAPHFSSEKKSDVTRLIAEVSEELRCVERSVCGGAAGGDETVPGEKNQSVQNTSIEAEYRGNEEATTESADEEDEDKKNADDSLSAKQPSHKNVTFKSHELDHDHKTNLSMEGWDQGFQCDGTSNTSTHEKADVITVHSTADGYVAWRHPQKGSVFVQSLVEVFAKRAHQIDLQTMLTEVLNLLHDQPMLDQLQIPEITKNTLRRKVYLLPGPFAPHCPPPALP